MCLYVWPSRPTGAACPSQCKVLFGMPLAVPGEAVPSLSPSEVSAGGSIEVMLTCWPSLPSVTLSGCSGLLLVYCSCGFHSVWRNKLVTADGADGGNTEHICWNVFRIRFSCGRFDSLMMRCVFNLNIHQGRQIEPLVYYLLMSKTDVYSFFFGIIL